MHPSPNAAMATSISTPRQHAVSSGALPFLLGCMLLGTVGVFVQEAHAAPITATWFRCAFGLLGLTAWMAWRRQLPLLRLPRRAAPWVLASGVLMIASWTLFFQAMTYTSAGMAIVLFHVQPLWLLLFGALWLGERVRGQRLAAVLVALFGLALATGVLQHLPVFGAEDLHQSGYWLGVSLCMAGAVCMAGVTLCAKKAQTSASALAWWQCLLGALTLWIWPVQYGWPAWGGAWLWLAGLGLVHTALAYTLIYAGTLRLPTSRIAIFQFVYPAVAIVIDWLYFRQALSTAQLIGIAVLTVAISVAERPSRPLPVRQ